MYCVGKNGKKQNITMFQKNNTLKHNMII